MNFFSHLVVASWYTSEAPTLLGSMLPDFTSMVGRPAPLSEHPDLQAGIRLHHQTDDHFHRTPQFRALNQIGHLDLLGEGMPKGAARAIAHIGVEIILDGVLAEDQRALRAFGEALELGSRGQLFDTLVWGVSGAGAGDTSAAASERLSALCRFLATRDIHKDSSDPSAITLRLQRTLAERPRLSIPAETLPRVEAWVKRLTPQVYAEHTSLIQQLKRELDNVVSR